MKTILLLAALAITGNARACSFYSAELDNSDGSMLVGSMSAPTDSGVLRFTLVYETLCDESPCVAARNFAIPDSAITLASFDNTNCRALIQYDQVFADSFGN